MIIKKIRAWVKWKLIQYEDEITYTAIVVFIITIILFGVEFK